MTRHVAIYCRISKDPRGRVEGVKAQETWGRRYAAEHWPDLPVVAYTDNSISAADDTHRPGYEALRQAIGRGEVAHLWAVEQSRLERRETEWFRLAAELDAAGIAKLHTNRDGIVRVRDEIAGIKAVINAGEIRKMKARVNDRLATIASEGRPAGSRVFGYRHGLDDSGAKTLHIVESEAALIRDAAEKVLAGWSLTSIAREYTRQGHHGAHAMKVRDPSGEVVTDGAGQPVTRPSTITGRTIASWFNAPTIIGHRVHRGVDRGRGTWEPILAEDIWHAVRDRLAAPRVVHRSDGGTYPVSRAPRRMPGRRYLLTGGIAQCGICHAPLAAALKQLRGIAAGKPYYFCHPNVGGRGCVGIMGPELEMYVVDRLMAELNKPDFLAAVAADEHAADRDRLVEALRAVEAKRTEMAAGWARDELTVDEWRSARAGLAEREQWLRLELSAMPAPMGTVDVATVREAWDAMTLDERRELVGMFVGAVVIKRAQPGRRGFDAGRVEIAWRTR